MFEGINTKKNRRSLIIAILVAVLVLANIGVTIAYLTHSSGPVENTFKMADITCQIEEDVTDGIKSSVKVQNTGDTSAYIRVAVIANTVDKDGAITGPADVSSNLCGQDWVKSGDYYYYINPVEPNGFTSELLKSQIELEGIQVTILSEAIQSEPVDAVQDAWGVKPAELGLN